MYREAGGTMARMVTLCFPCLAYYGDGKARNRMRNVLSRQVKSEKRGCREDFVASIVVVKSFVKNRRKQYVLRK